MPTDKPLTVLDREEGLALSALFQLALRTLREHASSDPEVGRLAVQAGPLVFRMQAELHAREEHIERAN